MSAESLPARAAMLLCLLLPAAAAQADFRFLLADESGDSLVVYAIKEGKVRMQPDASQQRFMLYDSSTETMYMVDAENRRYTRIDRKTMETVSGAMNEAMKQMEERMAALSPEQREAMKRYMPDLGAMKKAPVVRVERSGEFETVGGIRCENVSIYSDNSVKSKLCVADREALDMSREDYATVNAMFKTMQEFAKEMPRVAAGSASFPDIGGIPVSADDADTNSRLQLREHSNDALPAGDFSIPEGYSETKMAMPGG